MTHAIQWFEIPVTDYERAVEFYSTVLDREIDEYGGAGDGDMEGRYGLIRTDEGEIGGALAQLESYTPEGSDTAISYTPSDDGGPIVYLGVVNVAEALSAVESAGGTVLMDEQTLEEGGHYAIVGDTEGNRVGLMSDA